jgi:hypothetical protein
MQTLQHHQLANDRWFSPSSSSRNPSNFFGDHPSLLFIHPSIMECRQIFFSCMQVVESLSVFVAEPLSVASHPVVHALRCGNPVSWLSISISAGSDKTVIGTKVMNPISIITSNYVALLQLITITYFHFQHVGI